MPARPTRGGNVTFGTGDLLTVRAFDVVVIGGGTAGCVVAGRASEDASLTVLLVEAGPDPRPTPEVVADPRRQSEVVLESPFVRLYEVDRADGSTFPMLSGKIMGGGSSVNNLVAVRPMRADFDRWQDFGGPGWSYEALLPVMRDIEDDPDFPDSPIHGIGGPLRLERSFSLDGPADPPVRALIRAAEDLGLPKCPDLNVPEPFGVCASPYNIRDGVRQSTSVAYLDAARDRPNLTILADTMAVRILMEGSRAIGVELITPEGPETIRADRIVVSSGVYHSPQLLQLSGIGPADQLEALDIPVIHHLPGVGSGYQDHAVVYVTFQGTSELREDYVIPKVRLIARSSPEMEVPDLHVFMRPSIRMAGLPPMLPVSLHLLDHRSTGRVSLRSTDPFELPIVDPGLLRHADDVLALTNGIGLVARLAAHRELAAFYGEMITPGPQDDWTEHVLTTYSTYHHGVGTCRLGRADDPASVVASDLRIHGLENVWVADGSVLPTVPHANTNLAAILVGEVMARQISGRASRS